LATALAGGAACTALIVAGVLALAEYAEAAIAAGGVGLAAGLWTLLWRAGGVPAGSTSNLAAPLGTGPHAAVACPPTREAVEKLAQTMDQLRQATEEERPDIPWGAYEEQAQAALRALEMRNLSRAARHYTLAISALMAAVREHPRR
jgi:hypothetical protein